MCCSNVAASWLRMCKAMASSRGKPRSRNGLRLMTSVSLERVPDIFALPDQGPAGALPYRSWILSKRVVIVRTRVRSHCSKCAISHHASSSQSSSLERVSSCQARPSRATCTSIATATRIAIAKLRLYRSPEDLYATAGHARTRPSAAHARSCTSHDADDVKSLTCKMPQAIGIEATQGQRLERVSIAGELAHMTSGESCSGGVHGNAQDVAVIDYH